MQTRRDDKRSSRGAAETTILAGYALFSCDFRSLPESGYRLPRACVYHRPPRAVVWTPTDPTMVETRSRMGLCLCGGGVTGAMYQVGCLAALEDRIEGFAASEFDVFVGTGSGATVALALAGGLNVQRMYRALLDPADDFFPLQRNHLLRIDMSELLRGFGSAIAAARHVVSSAATSPLDMNVWDELERFVDSLPAGMFTLDRYERFLSDFMQRRDVPHALRRHAPAAVHRGERSRRRPASGVRSGRARRRAGRARGRRPRARPDPVRAGGDRRSRLRRRWHR